MKVINITIDEKKKQFEFPESWEEVSVDMYTKLINIDYTQQTMYQRMEVISIILKLPQKLINYIDMEDFERIEKEIKWIISLNEEQTQWNIGELPTYENDFIELNNELYYFHKLHKMNVGERISLETLIERTKGDITKCYSDLLCIILRKKVNGKIELFENEFMERVSYLKEVPFYKVNGMMVFFSKAEKE